MRMSHLGPTGHAHPAPWRRWMLLAAVTASFVTLLVLPRGAAPGRRAEPRGSWPMLVPDGPRVTIGPAYQVTGTPLAGSRLPLPSRSRWAVTLRPVTRPPTTSRSPPPPRLSSLPSRVRPLPLLLLGGFIFSRSAPRVEAASWRPGAPPAAKPRVIDAEPGHPVHRRGRLTPQ